MNSAVPALVNDLDIRLTDSNTDVTFPWKLELSNVGGLAVKGDNLVDTVENIDITVPVAGSYTLTVSHKGTLQNSSPQAFSLIVTGTDIALSTKDNTISDFFIWPNPVNDILNFKFNSLNNNKVNIAIIDIQGREVYSNTLTSNNSVISSSIDASGLSNGIYFLRIDQGNASINKKVIIN